MSSSGCVTCEKRNKKCDRTRGPNGCRRCVQAGLKCEGYLLTKTPKSTRGVRDNVPQARTFTTHHGSPSHSIPNQPDPYVALSDASGSGGHNFAASLDWSTPSQSSEDGHSQTSGYGQILTPPIEQLLTPPLENTTIPSVEFTAFAGQMPTPPIEGDSPLPRIDGPMTLNQASSLDSIFGVASVVPWAPKSPGSGLVMRRGPISLSQSHTEPLRDWQVHPDDNEADPEDPENLQAELLKGLVLDRRVESNMISFLVHSFTSWMNRFLFEPARVIPLFREAIVRGHSYGPEAHQKMILIANAVLNVSESMDYDLTPFTTLYSESVKGVVEARARGNLSMEMAILAMQSCHEIISIMCKVCSLASILNTMDLYAPVFRRACPESGTELVNLPRILTSFDVHLKLYATMDVLLSAVTHRPMFFRYNLEFPSQQAEDLMNSDDGPGLRWLAGVPDRLIVTLARMNTYLEDYGGTLDPERVEALETEIAACATSFSSGNGTDPTLALGRIVVQEGWRLVALIYLYMGLCGADSSDSRVVNAQKKFMRLLGGVRPRRNPDTFLVVPLMILGAATPSPIDQSIILARLWGISECKKPETLGNDMIRMLTDIWARTTQRPIVWADVRLACSRVTDM
ncbi:unnamed protein product [Rhizoctonia solani]|uniref:Zn(2)-C6 fungal-type domain-containing protein n=1 Tax=Rhizoctonia solani TaxID=456999 RepID=A0A8H3D0S0_9AGAM|nr:unnamed protein product [Rhizoctonia solani]